MGKFSEPNFNKPQIEKSRAMARMHLTPPSSM
jgi:hypothetical protein